jgi:hypothetical protein
MPNNFLFCFESIRVSIVWAQKSINDLGFDGFSNDDEKVWRGYSTLGTENVSSLMKERNPK